MQKGENINNNIKSSVANYFNPKTQHYPFFIDIWFLRPKITKKVSILLVNNTEHRKRENLELENLYFSVEKLYKKSDLYYVYDVIWLRLNDTASSSKKSLRLPI